MLAIEHMRAVEITWDHYQIGVLFSGGCNTVVLIMLIDPLNPKATHVLAHILSLTFQTTDNFKLC